MLAGIVFQLGKGVVMIIFSGLIAYLLFFSRDASFLITCHRILRPFSEGYTAAFR